MKRWRVLLNTLGATDQERANVEDAARAMLAWEAGVPGPTGEQVLERTRPDISRFCALAVCAIRRADELRGCPCGHGRRVRA